MKSLLLTILALSSTSAFAEQATLASFGGPGVKIYDGTNGDAWVYKSCKVIIAGTENTPVVYVSISDSANTYVFWAYSKSFVSSPGGDSVTATASDSMNKVPGSENTYMNVAELAGGIADIKLRKYLTTGQLGLVQFKHYSSTEGKMKASINCYDLKLRQSH